MEQDLQNVATDSHSSELTSHRTERRSGIRLHALVDQAIDAVRSRAEARQVVVQTKYDSRQRLVQVDEDRLRRAVTQLLLNGLKYAEPNRPLSVWTYLNPAFVEIGVRNAGGYPKSGELPSGAGGEASSHRVGAVESLGLDMALVKHFVELQDGRIEPRASTRHGAPASMVIRLPGDVALPVAAPLARGSTATHTSPSTQLEGTHVLLVEDDPDALEFLTLVLRSAGARVSGYTYTAPAYAFFVSASPDDRPDVIISDIAMPIEDGYSFLRRMRSWEARNAALPVPAIAVTAFSREEDYRRALVSGFDRHVCKPLDAGRLVETIAQWA